MGSRFWHSLILVSALISTASAQIVRFQTNVGSFDLVLNPTSTPLLQGHVDNMLHYVLSGRYDGTAINRADKDALGNGFVLQMGSFALLNTTLPADVGGFIPIELFDPIQGVPAANIGLSNTYGMVGLALKGSFGGTDRNSGQSSFYINLDNNYFLDSDFAIFAQVADMSIVNAIMALPTIDLTNIPGYGASPGNLYFTDVPLVSNNNLVVISRASVVDNYIGPPGDYNLDGKIGAADYVVWRHSSARGIIGAGLAGDGTRNGVVDGADYNIWRGRFGGTAFGTAASSTVPEPTLCAILLPAMLQVLSRKARS